MIYNIKYRLFFGGSSWQSSKENIHSGKKFSTLYHTESVQVCRLRERLCLSLRRQSTQMRGVLSALCIYGASLIILYTMSTLYHSFTNEKVKAFFRIMDHNTIFLLIAGTYTPITLYYLNGVTGWILFGIVWALAIFGIVMNSINLEKARIPSIFCYIGMGWVIIFAIKPLMEHMPSISGIFLIVGGVFYTVGIIFYAIKRVKYFHSIWHLFTVAGSVFHYFAILLGFFQHLTEAKADRIKIRR